MRLLTPTENKRLNELIGFLCITLAVLIALALLSYSPKDAAFNVSAAAPDGGPARNWIGPAGAYGADLLFQIFGFAAFLLPAAILVLGWRWFRSRAIDSQVATLFGYGLLLLCFFPPSFPCFLSFPLCAGHIPAGGLIGGLVSNGLLAGLNRGAYLVAPAMLIVAIFMTTRFSFSGAHAWASGPNGPNRTRRKTRHLAEGNDALALVERRARTGAHAAACRGDADFWSQASHTAIFWQCCFAE